VDFASLREHKLLAPQLMVTEASSSLHEIAWRGEITKPRAKTMLERLLKAPVEIRTPDGPVRAAWSIADELEWATTYDAHYVAFARLLKCRLVMIDEQLLR
jgi:predicted nucleic acid-binding protein